jgi:hypothetical protein
VDYLVQDRVPMGAVVLFVAPPKAGKSTAARALAFAVARGEPWLGWRTAFGAVWYLAFEDQRREVRRHFRQMGATGTEPIHLFIGQGPADLLPQLQARAEQEHPALIIVDTLSRLIHARDFNDYAEITERFDPLLKLARTTGATLFVLHHGSAHAQREGLDAVLGSTAVSASVDNILILKRVDHQRVLSSVQRIGPDLEPTIITLDPNTGHLERRGSKQQFDDQELADRILDVLRGEPAPVTESFLNTRVEGRRLDQARVIRRLLGMGLVCRVGRGRKADPFKYHVLGDPEYHVLQVLRSGNVNRSVSSSGLFENLHSEAPDLAKTPHKHESDSGSQISADHASVQHRILGPGASVDRIPGPDPGADPGNIGTQNLEATDEHY